MLSNTTTLIDVRLSEDFDAEHIPDALSCCVFEVGFLERVAAQVPDQATPLRVYGTSAESAEAGVAVEKLHRAGYSDVEELAGGLAAWKQAGNPTETGVAIPTPPPPEGRFEIDLTESRAIWTGRNLINSHFGTLGIKSGHLVFSGGMLTSGVIVFDMDEIHCSDLADSEMHDVLIAHLKNDDFFDVARFPEAELNILSASPVPGETAGGPNLKIEAELTLKGQTHPISFVSTAGLGETGSPAAQATFSIDRTLWGVLYGSGKFFTRLAGHLVNDHIEIQARVLTK